MTNGPLSSVVLYQGNLAVQKPSHTLIAEGLFALVAFCQAEYLSLGENKAMMQIRRCFRETAESYHV